MFHDFPLKQSYSLALHAAASTEIASQGGKFWAIHDILFENQNVPDDKSLKSNAEKIGLDAEKLA